MSHPSKVKGWADELRDRDVYLSRVWPDVDTHPNKQHPTRDHDGTGHVHVQSKKRKTWNIKDVVRDMFSRVPEDDEWIILYSDGDKRKVDAIKDDVAIMPAVFATELLDVWWNGYENSPGIPHCLCVTCLTHRNISMGLVDE